MAVGYQAPTHSSWMNYLRFRFAKSGRLVGLLPAFYSGSADNTHELFGRSEMTAARATYLESLRAVARDGILAAALHLTPGYAEYLPKYLRWLDDNHVVLRPENYLPFYSIYALLCGPDSVELVRGRRVLVVTSWTPEKKMAVEWALGTLGARSVQCYPVSPNRAMFDEVQLSSVVRPVDVVLIGAGVGAVRILEQVRPLEAVAIDAGFAIDALAFPEKRWNRPFCVPDSEFDEEKIRFLGRRDIAMLRRLNAEQGRVSPALDRVERILQSR